MGLEKRNTMSERYESPNRSSDGTRRKAYVAEFATGAAVAFQPPLSTELATQLCEFEVQSGVRLLNI